jgi:hypothetical protein
VYDSGWKRKLVGCTADGAPENFGKVRGVMTRLREAICSEDEELTFLTVWCSMHQQNLKLVDAITSIKTELQLPFIRDLNALISYFNRQKESIGSVPGTWATTRWSTLVRVLRWFSKNKRDLVAHLTKRRQPQPPSVFWLLVDVMYVFLQNVNVKSTLPLQRADLLLAESVENLDSLSRALVALCGAQTITESEDEQVRV